MKKYISDCIILTTYDFIIYQPDSFNKSHHTSLSMRNYKKYTHKM